MHACCLRILEPLLVRVTVQFFDQYVRPMLNVRFEMLRTSAIFLRPIIRFIFSDLDLRISNTLALEAIALTSTLFINLL